MQTGGQKLQVVGLPVSSLRMKRAKGGSVGISKSDNLQGDNTMLPDGPLGSAGEMGMSREDPEKFKK